MTLTEFLKSNYNDYIYLMKPDNSAVIDIAVKFIPFWIIHEYGSKEVCVEVDVKAKAKYQVYKVWIKN